MAEEMRAFDVTLNAGSSATSPQTVNMSMPPRTVRRIEVLVPPGPRGNVGFRIGMAGGQLIPYNPGGWIIADGETLGWDFDGLPSSGAWQLIGYNQGIYAHTLHLRFLVELPAAAPSTDPRLLPADSLDAALADFVPGPL